MGAELARLGVVLLRRHVLKPGAVAAVIIWIGFTAARLLTHDLFERRPGTLTAINMGHELVTVVVMGLIIGAFGFPG